MAKYSLYNICVQKVLLLLRERTWKPGPENPFCFFPVAVVQDLLSAYLGDRHPNGFKAADLEPLLSSGKVREFTVYDIEVDQELGPALKSLASGSQNLVSITLIELSRKSGNTPNESEVLQELLRKSPNLKVVHCEVEFDLKALRHCKKLEKIMLHFEPGQPLCDFLERKYGQFQSLDSLEMFKFCNDISFSEPSYLKVADNFATILRYCPAMTSIGYLESSGVLERLYPNRVLLREKLSRFWRNMRFLDNRTPNNNFRFKNLLTAAQPELLLNELYFHVYSPSSILHFSRLKHLVLMDIRVETYDDISVLICHVLKDIGHNLKYLSFKLASPVDMSVFLQNCPNLVAFRIHNTILPKFAEPTVCLPNLKSLTVSCYEHGFEKVVLPLFSECNNLEELLVVLSNGLDDKTLEKFASRNSLSNLKMAFFDFFSLELTEHGLQKFLMNAPNLEKIEVISHLEEELEDQCFLMVENALFETNHNAFFSTDVTYCDEYFDKPCELT